MCAVGAAAGPCCWPLGRPPRSHTSLRRLLPPLTPHARFNPALAPLVTAQAVPSSPSCHPPCCCTAHPDPPAPASTLPPPPRAQTPRPLPPPPPPPPSRGLNRIWHRTESDSFKGLVAALAIPQEGGAGELDYEDFFSGLPKE